MSTHVHIICGAGSAIATALASRLCRTPHNRIIGFSRDDFRGSIPSEHAAQCVWIQCDHSDNAMARAVESLATHLADDAHISSVSIFNGPLHDEQLQPERALKRVEREHLSRLFESNTIVPLLWLQALVPLLEKNREVTITTLSARVGSIEDNQLGGWYGYRASKAALNMLLKTASIELARTLPNVKLIAFHPGTTDTPLSKPFQKSVPAGKLFSPDFVAEKLINLWGSIKRDRTLSYVDWDSKAINW